MITLTNCKKLLEKDFSLITLAGNKSANFPWKDQQTKLIDLKEFEKRYNYEGGIIKKDGHEIPRTEEVALVTGYADVEVIDIDLKVLHNAKDQKEFWNEFITFASDNILDFYDKFTIYKTVNNGFHILYKTKEIEPNQVLAKLKGDDRAILETRGKGGYVVIYDGRNETELTYKDVKYISKEDREILMAICDNYDYKEPKQDVVFNQKESKEYTGLKPSHDYNNKTSIIDLIKDEFDIVRNLSDKYIIKRHGATSFQSGYVYKDSGGMYLYSTGTIYPVTTLLMPHAIYAYKHFGGDFSEACKQLYKDGYGDRRTPEKLPESKEFFIDNKYEINQDELKFPVDIFPIDIQYYIQECNKKLKTNIDYMGCTMLFATSISIGNCIVMKVRNQWVEPAIVWFSLVGKKGLGKTPSINAILSPLKERNKKEIKRHKKLMDKYDYYNSLDKKEKDLAEEVHRPIKTQFIVTDITMEALDALQEEQPYGMGIFRDEQSGWLMDMNKYRQGGDVQNYLSMWSGESNPVTRKTAKSVYVDKSFVSILGGIQPEILSKFNNEENNSNGFIDRMLFSFPDTDFEYYNENEIPEDLSLWFKEYMIKMFDTLKGFVSYDRDNEEIIQHHANWDKEAKEEWIRISNDITAAQLGDEENEYTKAMLPKQRSYIPRFALIINTINAFDNGTNYLTISKESVLKAERLSKYFIAMSKKNKSESDESNGILEIILDKNIKNDYDKFKAIYSLDPNTSKQKIALALNTSKRTVYRYIKKYEDEKK